MIRSVPYMGVIWVVHEASKLGFYNGHPDWCNLGQGQPEVGELEGAPERVSSLRIQPGDHAYGPVGGTLEAREAVAELYNRSFRRGMRFEVHRRQRIHRLRGPSGPDPAVFHFFRRHASSVQKSGLHGL